MGLGDSIKRLTKTLGLAKGKEGDADSSKTDIDLNRLQDSESESEIEHQNDDEANDSANDNASEAESDPEADMEEEEDVALSEVELDDDADVVPHQKTTINNRNALRQSLKSIELPQSAQKELYEHMSITGDAPLELKDIYDDTERELAFYKQALDAVVKARKILKSAGIPFSRPVDYFAEMVKSDEHMERIKRKLVDEETAKRSSQEARRQRELKKFGKKVQHEKLQERQVEKRKTLERISKLKKKRQNNDIGADQFDVEIEEALQDKKKDRDERFRLGGSKRGVNKQANYKRQAKNSKFGHGGRKRGMNRNSAESSMDISGFSNKRRKH